MTQDIRSALGFYHAVSPLGIIVSPPCKLVPFSLHQVHPARPHSWRNSRCTRRIHRIARSSSTPRAWPRTDVLPRLDTSYRTEYWISKDRYWCKYCSIYIADDKPSRIHHETGLKHKGNYERYIREIYKRGERDKRDKKEEAEEIARIEQAARIAMGPSALDLGEGTSSTPQASTSKPTAGPPDSFASYTTAADLGFKDEVTVVDPKVEALEKDKETRQTEGIIGQWQVVKKKKPQLTTAPTMANTTPGAIPPSPQWMQNLPGYSNGVKLENEVKGEKQDEQGTKQHEPEQDQPKAPRYLNEKAYTADDDDYDPNKVGPVKLKRKILTLKEQQEIDDREREKKRIKEEMEEQRKRAKLERGNGWSQVEVGDEGLLEFEDPPEAEDDVKQEHNQGGDVTKPSIAEEQEEKPKVTSGFKKRKMHGANAVRKK
ncbi:BQ2448_6538 [Microbotryum intermedium]|uniref:BQ2448_6538 protein n=1 Tax=Microbotryum intermedium TaxID=269621 RepID=A0A238FSL8_9BASI|nr:BQ2448_6538 [Microbotryum intermedium]